MFVQTGYVTSVWYCKTQYSNVFKHKIQCIVTWACNLLKAHCFFLGSGLFPCCPCAKNEFSVSITWEKLLSYHLQLKEGTPHWFTPTSKKKKKFFMKF